MDQEQQGVNQLKMVGQKIIARIVKLKNQNNQLFMQRFSIQNLISNIQKHQMEVVEMFSRYFKEGFNLIEFVRFFLNIIPHRTIETLYLTIGLIDLFRQITITNHKQKIRIRDLTDYMCDVPMTQPQKILKPNKCLSKIEAKYNPFKKFVSPNKQKKHFLQNPPYIFGQADKNIHKLCQKSIKTDSSKHSRAILKSQFCLQLKLIFILDSLSQSISVYDQHCTLHKKITPILSKLKKQVIILSFDFSKRQLRIGAALKDFTLKFWDHQNSFQYQKSISTTSHCINLQTSIYFLQYFSVWITTDKTGSIHCWNLLDEKLDRIMRCKYRTNINDVCQIPAHNLLVVVQECKRNSRMKLSGNERNESNVNSQTKVILYNFFSGHIITQIQLGNERIPHTIAYSETYQVIFMAGLQKKIKIYELHPIFMDYTLKGELIGHQHLITSFTLIQNTPMLISADDKALVKLQSSRFTAIISLKDVQGVKEEQTLQKCLPIGSKIVAKIVQYKLDGEKRLIRLSNLTKAFQKYKGLETTFESSERVFDLWNNFQILSSIEPPVQYKNDIVLEEHNQDQQYKRLKKLLADNQIQIDQPMDKEQIDEYAQEMVEEHSENQEQKIEQQQQIDNREDKQVDEDEQQSEDEIKQKKQNLNDMKKRLNQFNKMPQNPQFYQSLILANPTPESHMLYISSLLNTSTPEEIRAQLMRAINSLTDIKDKDNMWISWINMELILGDFTGTVKKAIQAHVCQHVYFRILDILSEQENWPVAIEFAKKMLKKFNRQPKVYIAFLKMVSQYSVSHIVPDSISPTQILRRASQCLKSSEVIKIEAHRAKSMFDLNQAQRGRNIFQEIVTKYPKRTDLWSMYVDQQVKHNHIDKARNLLERALSLGFKKKNTVSILKKYLQIEKAHGTQNRVKQIIERAQHIANSYQAEDYQEQIQDIQ